MNVLTGNFLYFDNNKEVIGPEHVMASGALPPALPMVKIGTVAMTDIHSPLIARTSRRA